MRSQLARSIAVALTCLVMAGRFQAQSVPSGFAVTCPALSELEQQYGHQEQRPSGPRIVVADITFSGVTQLPPSEQRKIAATVEQQTSGYSVEAATDEAVERARAAWQDRGYFEAKATGKVINVSSLPAGKSISVQVHVDEGLQYRLGEITFKGNRAIRDTLLLRGLFPVKDGGIFSRVKIAEGLENLRRAYGELGYLNFTSVPETLVDDRRLVISLVVDIDEDKQFHIGSIRIIGLDEGARQEILKDFPIGRIYNERPFRLFLEKHSSTFKLKPDDPRLTERRLDEATGTISITLYACPCPVC